MAFAVVVNAVEISAVERFELAPEQRRDARVLAACAQWTALVAEPIRIPDVRDAAKIVLGRMLGPFSPAVPPRPLLSSHAVRWSYPILNQ